jgi:hypothetical protein
MSGLTARDRSRSPRFPSQNLGEAIRLTESIYEGVHRSMIDSETAFKLMGYSGKTGTSAKALGSLRQFGLIEGIGEKTRVSDLALAILEPESSVERANAIRQSAKTPDVFDSVITRFGGRVPQADEPIRAYLIRELGFQKGSADECIRSLRSSLAFAGNEDSIEVQPNDTEVQEAEPNVERQDSKGFHLISTAPREEPAQSVVIPLSRDCKAELKIFGRIDDKAVANLIKHIDLLASVWTEN